MPTPLSKKATAPLGTPMDGDAGSTLAVNVTGCPNIVGVVGAVKLVTLGARATVSVSICVAVGAKPLFAVTMSVYGPPRPGAGVPLKTPFEPKVTPLGNDPVSVTDGVGLPVVVTVKLPAPPTTKVVEAALVIAGAFFAALIVRVKLCVAFVPTPFAAVMVSAKVPLVPAAGVPARVAVPFELFVNVTPVGSAPDSLSEGVGEPVAVTVNVPAVPIVNAVLLALVIAGA